MSEGMIGLLSLDEVRGAVGDLVLKLVGSEGPTYAAELKKFVLKQPCWPREARQPSGPLMEGSQCTTAWPAPGEVFELTMEKPFTGLAMVRDTGFSNLREWRFTGKEITKPVTKRFKLIEIGYQQNFESVKRELGKHGTIPEGQWRKAATQKFSGAPGRPVGVADSSWVGPVGGVNFPYVSGDDGDGHFYWTDDDFGGGWLWLVEVK